MSDLATSYVHCETQLRAEDHDGWLAALFAPSRARPHLHALGAFALEVGHVRSRVRQPLAGEIRLQWWQDVIDGERATEAAAHPVATALRDTIARASLPAEPFGDMLDAYRMTLYDEPPVDLAALERRLAARHGAPIRLAARVLGGGPSADTAAADAGIAVGIAGLLDDLRGGRCPPLPVALLARHGAHQSDVVAGRPSPALEAVVAELRTAARTRVAALRAAREGLEGCGPAYLRALLVEQRLARGDGASDIFSPMPDVPRWRRQWRLWREARAFRA